MLAGEERFRLGLAEARLGERSGAIREWLCRAASESPAHKHTYRCVVVHMDTIKCVDHSHATMHMLWTSTNCTPLDIPAAPSAGSKSKHAWVFAGLTHTASSRDYLRVDVLRDITRSPRWLRGPTRLSPRVPHTHMWHCGWWVQIPAGRTHILLTEVRDTGVPLQRAARAPPSRP